MVETELFSKLGTIPINNEYLSEMTDEQTLTMWDIQWDCFHLIKKHQGSSVTNGMVTLIILNRMIGKNECLRRITIGQMTAGSYMYIGPARNCTWHNHHSTMRFK
jgi:urocanate hydratase